MEFCVETLILAELIFCFKQRVQLVYKAVQHSIFTNFYDVFV